MPHRLREDLLAALALLPTFALPCFAEGGVAYRDVADAVGVTYRRTPSASK